MTTGSFTLFYWLLHNGHGLEQARNLLLLLFVLFENLQTFNSRSERHSMFQQGFLSNPFLVIGVIGTQALHIIAMYVPGLSDILRIAPVSLEEWMIVLLIATSLPAVMEFEKWRVERRTRHHADRCAARACRGRSKQALVHCGWRCRRSRRRGVGSALLDHAS